MSVFKRKTSKGFTDSFHYRFYHGGKIYTGICEKCLTKTKALEYEKAEREKIIAGTAAIRDKRKTRKKAEKIITSILGTVTIPGIPIEQAFAESLKKPKKRKATGDFLHAKESYWRDLVAFMKDKFPGVLSLKDVDETSSEHMDISSHGHCMKTRVEREMDDSLVSLLEEDVGCNRRLRSSVRMV